MIARTTVAAALVLRDFRDQRAVDLHFAERHLVELRQRGGAGAEVIERQADAFHAQAREDVHHQLGIVERGRFGHFERELLGRDFELAQDARRAGPGNSRSCTRRGDRFTAAARSSPRCRQ